ncbi:MAG: sulfotransferase [Candidatus Thermoplasmatota archaeon]|nr:sulfotransferase [Candidatus Thermoplasmatota archaeon]
MYEPLAGSSLSNLFRLLAQNNFHVSLKYVPRFSYAFLMSSVLTFFRLKESLRESKKIQSTQISKDPIFIIGHWRSGTTYLHNLLSLNSSFGYCSTFHATLPHVFLQSETLLKPLLSASIPSKRPMDDVSMGPDLPQEEEYAIANIIPDGYYNGWCFPKNMTQYMNHVLIENVSKPRQKEWIDTYLFFVRKLTCYHQGKQLLLKNPAHTARISILKRMFPDAKFIHIHRNPYEIYYSMEKFMHIVLPRYCVQNVPSKEKMKQMILKMYSLLYQSYLKQKTMVTSKDLIELSYETFIADPLTSICNIHNQFNLSLDGKTEKSIQDYVKKQHTFKRSSYTMDDELKKDIYEKWKFAFQAFQYSR